MSDKGPFGLDPEEFDRVVREAGAGLRDAFDRVGKFLDAGHQPGWGVLFNEFAGSTKAGREPETTGDTGAGVWVIYTVEAGGAARIEQVYPTELDALRANKSNTDPARKVRFLPYGMAVSVLDTPLDTSEDRAADGGEDSPSG